MTRDGEKLAVLGCWQWSVSAAEGTLCPWRILSSVDDSVCPERCDDTGAWPVKAINNINTSDEINSVATELTPSCHRVN